ncbi:MAG: hypothetical protein QF489_08850 [Planctomycetota bacterium]|jgi:hypothetical protein|nr:hypothetical protein [Planctomycetota bacterium]
MPIFTRTPLMAIAVLLSWMALTASCGEALDNQDSRALGEYQNHQLPAYPGGFPSAWAAQFHLTMTNAPKLWIADPSATAVVRDLMLQMPWVDPESVKVMPALPQGLRLVYRPHLPVLAVSRGDRPIALLSEKRATVLPDGISEATMRQFIRVPLDEGVELPQPGRTFSDPVVQEAYRLWPEVDTIAQNTGLAVVAIQRKSTYPKDSPGIAPAMSFILDSGVEISWGRARDTPDPFAINADNEPLTMEQKALRLIAVLKQYPALTGVGKVLLDEPEAKVLDPRGLRLPLTGDIR